MKVSRFRPGYVSREKRPGKPAKFHYRYTKRDGSAGWVKMIDPETGAAVATKKRAESLLAGYVESHRQEWERAQREAERGPMWTLKELYDRVSETEHKNHSPGHQHNQKVYWHGKSGIFRFFGEDRPLDTIKPGDVVNFGRSIEAKNTTRNHYIDSLSAAMEEARLHEVIDQNPCRHPRVRKAFPDDTGCRERILTEEEYQNLLKVSPPMERAVFMLMGGAALRIGEALQLQWRDFDPAPGVLTLHHEPEKGRRVKGKRTVRKSLDPGIWEKVCGLLDPAGGSPWLFPMPADPTRHRGPIDHLVKKCMKAAGLEGVTSHHLRHTAISLIVESGDLGGAREQAGHRDFRMTSHYTHAGTRKAGETLGKFVKGKKEEPVTLQNTLLARFRPKKNAGELKREEWEEAMKSMVEWMERETRLELATLSLEG